MALDLSVTENITLSSLKRFTRLGFLDFNSERQEADELIRRLEIKSSGRDALVRTLSGGNQQKVAIAKWLSRHSEIYLLDEPTVGVDIGSKVEIYNLIGDLAARGAGMIVLSSDLSELIGITDRILVLFRGSIIREFVSSQTAPDGPAGCIHRRFRGSSSCRLISSLPPRSILKRANHQPSRAGVALSPPARCAPGPCLPSLPSCSCFR